MRSIFLMIAGLLVLIAPTLACAEAMRLSVTNPQQTMAIDVVNIPGKFVAKNEVSIGSPLQQQRVTAVFVEEGEWVEKGQLLATLESPLQSAAVKQLQAETEKATAYIKQQQALTAQSQKELQRLMPLAKTGVISANEFGKAKSEALSQQALLEASRAELRQLQAQLTREQSQEDKSKIIAPVSGVISERYAMNGTLSDNALLFKLIENNEIEFEAAAHSSELARIRGSNPVVIQLSENKQLLGKLRYLSPKIESLTQLGKMRVALNEAPNSIRIGEIATLVYANSPEEQLTLPYSAIRTETNGERFVFTVTEGVVTKQKVQTGKIQNGRVEILSPLATNLDVVTYAQAFLSQDDIVIAVKDSQ